MQLEHIPRIERLVALFNNCPVGGTTAYAEIEAAAGRPINEARALVYAAQKQVLESSGAVFTNVKGVGYSRVPPEGIRTIGVSARRAIRRKAKLAVKRMASAVQMVNSLGADERRKVSNEISILGMVQHIADARNTKAIDSPAPIAAPVGLAMLGAFLAQPQST